ncbi:hypothetical protein HNQ69_001091 [Bartonella callosciuri]|uniref:Uncharacterized protein n=1 Tax=Bartonella callosciuri TaxID=686223 RepID=A0A840NU76_9HYPH|nr:hypothetical protein [Bartonella callosciuri]
MLQTQVLQMQASIIMQHVQIEVINTRQKEVFQA